MKTSYFSLLLAGVVPLFLAMTARAEHFDIDLTVEGAGDRQEAHSDDFPPFAGSHRRPVFHGEKGETLQVRFLLKNVNPHDALKRVSIRYYFVPVKQGSLKSTPTEDAPAVMAGKFTMDFKMQGQLGFKQRLVIAEAGAYLLRVESANTGADHEHFSAIDLDIR